MRPHRLPIHPTPVRSTTHFCLFFLSVPTIKLPVSHSFLLSRSLCCGTTLNEAERPIIGWVQVLGSYFVVLGRRFFLWKTRGFPSVAPPPPLSYLRSGRNGHSFPLYGRCIPSSAPREERSSFFIRLLLHSRLNAHTHAAISYTRIYLVWSIVDTKNSIAGSRRCA